MALFNYFLLIPIVFFALLIGGDQNKQWHISELSLELIPGLAGPKDYVYRVVANCVNSCGKTIQADSANAVAQANGIDSVKFKFTTDEKCANFYAYIWMLMLTPSEANLMNAWPNAYAKRELPNNEQNNKIEFGNYFNLSIEPILKTEELFYYVQIFCDKRAVTKNGKASIKTVENDKVAEKTVEQRIIVVASDESDESDDDYKFNTFSKGTKTKVVFGSEKKQCNGYYIKVWTTHVELINRKHSIEERLFAHFVYPSGKLNGSNLDVSMAQHFQLQIEPPFSEEEENVYYVEVRCDNHKEYPFMTITKHKTDVVLQKVGCKTFDISARKILLKWFQLQHLEGYEKMIHSSANVYTEFDLNITNGHTYVLYTETKHKRLKYDVTEKERNKVAQQQPKTSNHQQEKLKTVIHISDEE